MNAALFEMFDEALKSGAPGLTQPTREGLARSLARKAAHEQDRLRRELERAYRALRGFYSFAVRKAQPDTTMLAYHGPTIAAALRFVDEGSLEGADYFVGKPVDVLHATLETSSGLRS